MSDEIDIDAVRKWFDENPFHESPEELLEAVFEWFECLEEHHPCLTEATHILDRWSREQPSYDTRMAEAEFFFMKWDFVDGTNPRAQ
jgi:hypothetical protein